jgi:hypothetical protein
MLLILHSGFGALLNHRSPTALDNGTKLLFFAVPGFVSLDARLSRRRRSPSARASRQNTAVDVFGRWQGASGETRHDALECSSR